MKRRLKESQKFKERGVYVHAPREEAMQDPDGKSRRGGSGRSRVTKCELEAQEFAKGDPRESFRRHSASFCRKAVGESNCEPGRRQFPLSQL